MRYLITLLTLILTMNMAISAPFKADAKTKRIPAGTTFKLQLLEPLSTTVSGEGDYFSAMLVDDQKAQTSVVLPAGSVVRGLVNKIVPSKRLSRGAIMYLDFDHIVTPNGRQLPLNMTVSGLTNLKFDGGIYGSLGYGEAIQKNWDKTVEITTNSTDKGIELGEDVLGGAAMALTVPVCALGGGLGGGLYFLGDSIIDLFRKGAEVNLNQGSVINVILTQPIDVPVN